MKNVLRMIRRRMIRNMNLNSLMNLSYLMSLNFWIHNLMIRCCRMICHLRNMKIRNRMIRFLRFSLRVQNSFLSLICFHPKEQNNCWYFCMNLVCFRFRVQNILKVNRLFSGLHYLKNCP